MDKDIKFDLNVPYYVPCIYPLISCCVKRKGLDASAALLINSRLLSIPAFSNASDEFVPEVQVKDAYMLGYNFSEKKLNIIQIKREIEEIGKLEYLRQYIKDNEMAIVSGTSYFLPYTVDYLNDKYIEALKNGRHIGIVNHWLCACDMDNEYVSVYDPVPDNFVGNISKAQFKDFWKGDQGVSQLQTLDEVKNLNKNGILDINIKSILMPQEITCVIKELLYTVKFEYFNNRVISHNNKNYYYGEQALEKLKEAYLELVNNKMNNNAIEKIWRCFFEMKFSLLFLQLLIEEIEDLYEHNILIGIKESLAKSIDIWGNIERKVKVNLLRGKSLDLIKETVLSQINAVLETENRVYDLIGMYKD